MSKMNSGIIEHEWTVLFCEASQLFSEGSYESSLSVWAQLAAIQSTRPIHYNLALCYLKTHNYQGAITILRHLSKQGYEVDDCRAKQAYCLMMLSQYEPALKLLESLLITSSSLETHINRNICLIKLGRLVLAEQGICESIENFGIVPELFESYAKLLFIQGRHYASALAYEYRAAKRSYLESNNLNSQEWSRCFQSGILMIYTEQGFGDSIQNARFLPYLACHKMHIIVQCEVELIPFFSKIYPKAQYVDKLLIPPKHDYILSLQSIGYALGFDCVPPVHHLISPALQIPSWLQSPKPRIGLVWAGSGTISHRNINPYLLSNIVSKYRDYEFLSLQIGKTDEKISFLANNNVTDVSHYMGNFAESLLVIASLDLLVTIDTATAHLSGYSKTRTILLLSHDSDERWSAKDELYANIQYFGQNRSGCWDEPLDRLDDYVANL